MTKVGLQSFLLAATIMMNYQILSMMPTSTTLLVQTSHNRISGEKPRRSRSLEPQLFGPRLEIPPHCNSHKISLHPGNLLLQRRHLLLVIFDRERTYHRVVDMVYVYHNKHQKKSCKLPTPLFCSCPSAV